LPAPAAAGNKEGAGFPLFFYTVVFYEAGAKAKGSKYEEKVYVKRELQKL
jgi:hypothetical protein